MKPLAFCNYIHPKQITPKEFDFFLERGNFPIGQKLCGETHLVEFVDDDSRRIFETHCLRYRVADFSCRSSHRQILRAAQHFDVKVIPLTEVYWEFENLYWDYLSGVQFRTAQSLYDLLGIEYGQSGIFDAYFMVVSDKGEDIAIGIFYRGENSIAAISNFYNPKYNKYSLGKLLMLKIIQEAQRWGIQYYYPGYVTRGWSKFDYKLFLGEAHAETLDRSADKWVPFHAECLAPKSYSNSDVEDIVAAITNPTHTIL